MSTAGSLAVSLSSNAYVLSSGRDIEVEDLPDWLQIEDGGGESGEPSTLEELEGRFIREVLARNSHGCHVSHCCIVSSHGCHTSH
jgi:hypothetical protein